MELSSQVSLRQHKSLLYSKREFINKENYKPNSALSILFKICEKVLFDQLTRFLNNFFYFLIFCVVLERVWHSKRTCALANLLQK